MVITGRTVCVFGRQGAGQVPSLSSEFLPHLPRSTAHAHLVAASCPSSLVQGPAVPFQTHSRVWARVGSFLANVSPSVPLAYHEIGGTSPCQMVTIHDVLQPHGRVGWGTDGTLQGPVQEGMGTPWTSLPAGSGVQLPEPHSGPRGPSWGLVRGDNANGPDRLLEINGQKVTLNSAESAGPGSASPVGWKGK